LHADLGTDGVFQRFAAGGDNFASIIVTAVAANMVRALQLATIGALGMSLRGQGFVATTHAAP